MAIFIGQYVLLWLILKLDHHYRICILLISEIE